MCVWVVYSARATMNLVFIYISGGCAVNNGYQPTPDLVKYGNLTDNFSRSIGRFTEKSMRSLNLYTQSIGSHIQREYECYMSEKYSYRFYIVSYYIKRLTTSWTHSRQTYTKKIQNSIRHIWF